MSHRSTVFTLHSTLSTCRVYHQHDNVPMISKSTNVMQRIPTLAEFRRFRNCVAP